MANPLRDLVLPALDVDGVDRPWPLIRAGILGSVLLVLAIGIWVGLAPLSGAVMGPGFVKIDMNRKTVQHQEGGIVSEILVRDGSKVAAGQTLIVLKDVRVDAGNETVRTQLDAELAKVARLSAEQTGENVVTFPPELSARGSDPRVAELLRRESSVFRVRREALANQVALINSQVREAQDEIKARSAQLKADDEGLKFQREELAQNRLLAEQGFVSKTRLLVLQREAAQYESRRAEGAAELARAQQKVSDLELRAETLRSQFTQEASNELRQTTATNFELRERLRPALDAEQRQRILAPIAGTIVGLKVFTIVGVITPREPLLDIVPDHNPLIIESQVNVEDIDNLHVGLAADVRLTAYSQRSTAILTGRVTYVSADRMLDEATNTPFFRAHIAIDAASLAAAAKTVTLFPGMPAEVFVKTGARTALDYFLQPLTSSLRRSLREP